MADYFGIAAAFVVLSVTFVVSAAIRRSWRDTLYAVFFTVPAAAAWVAYARYESTLDLGVAPIRIDLPLLWAGLLAISLPAIMYALLRSVEIFIRLGQAAIRTANRKPAITKPSRSYQPEDNPLS